MIGGDPAASAKKAKRGDGSKDEGAHTNEIAVSIHQSAFPLDDMPQTSETRAEFLKYGLPLYKAAMEGEWETAQDIFNKDQRWITSPITKRNDTALHISAAAKQTEFVKKLVVRMINADDRLQLRNTLGNTAFCLAASSGITEIAKAMVGKNKNLPNIRGSKELLPIHMAILLGHRDMVLYLIDVTDDKQFSNDDRIEMLVSAIEADLFDVALRFLSKHPRLALERNANDETVLHALARKPLGTYRSKKSIWKGILKRCTNMGCDEDEQQLRTALQVVQKAWNEVIKEEEEMISELIAEPRLLFVAAEIGNVEFLKILILSYPDVIWKVNEDRQSIFHVAIKNRHEEIFKLIHVIGAIKDLIASYKDGDGNNMLHLAAMLAPPYRLNCVSGAALQMQRELLWFKVVQEVVRPQYAVDKNKFGKTPTALFTESHKELREQGEEWMKKTAESCTLVATLIATVVFTAAFTLPGGNNSDNGSPILVKRASFMVFAISNAVSLFASSTSILMFLSILTSRYAENDFLKSLPFKLLVGLTCLSVSIATMMMAFTATFFITFHDGVGWIPIPIALLAAVPVLLFAFQQSHLLIDIYRSTYHSWTLFQSTHGRKFCWTDAKQKTV